MVRTIGIEKDPAKRIRQRHGKAIQQVRDMRGITVKGLAEMVNVTEGAVRQWEKGSTSPRQHHQVAVAGALDVPWSTLFGLDGEAA